MRCRCGTRADKPTLIVRTRQWRPRTRRRRPTGRAAWPPHPGPSACICVRPICPPPAAGRHRQDSRTATLIACVFVQLLGECAESTFHLTSACFPRLLHRATSFSKVSRHRWDGPRSGQGNGSPKRCSARCEPRQKLTQCDGRPLTWPRITKSGQEHRTTPISISGTSCWM